MTPNRNSPQDDADDLAWLAFRYAADELDDEARAAFEARLEADPDAGAALADAVALLGACLRIGPVGPSIAEHVGGGRPPRRRRKRNAAFSLASLALAAGILLASLPIGLHLPFLDPGDHDGGEAIALELAWSGLQREQPLPLIDIDPEPWRIDPDAEVSPPAGSAGELEDHQPDLPRWLLSAVELADEAELGPLPREN